MPKGASYYLNGSQEAFPVPYPGDDVFLRVICAGNPSIDRLVDLCAENITEIRDQILALGDRIIRELDLHDTYLNAKEEFADSDLSFEKPSCAWLLVREAFCQLAEYDVGIEKSLREGPRQWLLGDYQRSRNYCSYRRQHAIKV